MMKKSVSLLLLLFALNLNGASQENNGLNTYLPSKEAKRDMNRVHQLHDSSNNYAWTNPELGIAYAKEALAISQELNYPVGIAMGYIVLGTNLRVMGDYAGAMDLSFRALNIFKKERDKNGIDYAQYALGGVYKDQGDYKHAVENFKMSFIQPELDTDSVWHLMHFKFSPELLQAYKNIELADCYNHTKNDSALVYAKQVFSYLTENGSWQFPFYVLGKAYANLNNYDSSLYFYKEGLAYKGNQNATDISKIRLGIAQNFQKMGMLDSTIYHASKAIEGAYSMAYLRGVNEASEILAQAYEKSSPAKSIQYYKLNKATGDSLYNQQKTRDVQNFAFRQELQEREIKQRLDEYEANYKNRLNIYILLGVLSILLVISLGLWRRSVFKNKAFTLVNKQKQEIETQKIKVEYTLQSLQSTQAQLIQSEKMASLGELTAGIAHEIQNPLNFVNNFSEVNTELIKEIQDERRKTQDKRDEKLEDELLNDIAQNQEKVLHHGKRADAIVKGMLQHSSRGSGVKEPTDINALCDEYLRLAYHGLRAKDKFLPDGQAGFNAKYETHLDPTLPKINVVPQDIGRVILNLINNAFYAVNEKAKQGIADYEPTVSVSTKKEGNKVLISVKDNGKGISDSIKEKIFQPFFTTKPTGQGTGLGLSLSYDIVKAHGGELSVRTPSEKVATNFGEGSDFTIQIPAFI